MGEGDDVCAVYEVLRVLYAREQVEGGVVWCGRYCGGGGSSGGRPVAVAVAVPVAGVVVVVVPAAAVGGGQTGFVCSNFFSL